MDANHQYDLRLFSQHTADMVNIKPYGDEQFSIYIDISDLQVVRSWLGVQSNVLTIHSDFPMHQNSDRQDRMVVNTGW